MHQAYIWGLQGVNSGRLIREEYQVWSTTEPMVLSHLFLSSIPQPDIMKWSELAQSCPTLCDPVDCSPPGSSFHGILKARILEWIAISFSRGSSQPRDRTRVSRMTGRCFILWAIREHMNWLIKVSKIVWSLTFPKQVVWCHTQDCLTMTLRHSWGSVSHLRP